MIGKEERFRRHHGSDDNFFRIYDGFVYLENARATLQNLKETFNKLKSSENLRVLLCEHSNL